jgi:ribosomal protein L40E
MSAFDEFVYGAKKCFDAAAVKTNEFIEASKIQIEKSQLNCELRDEYVKLGKACYDMSESGIDNTAKMQAIIERINSIKEELKLAEENFKSKKPKICHNCGSKNDYDFKYCSKCGSKLD